MKYHMDRTLRFWVNAECRGRRRRFPGYRRSQIIARILSDLECVGYASRYLRKDGKLGWRATDDMREDLFTREQDAVHDLADKIDDELV
jgi:hypothetical protein